MAEWIRLIIGAVVLMCGLAFFVMEIYGIFKYDYVINRMHAAAIGDTMGISLSLAGLMIFSGLNFTTLKIALIVVFFWFSAPVASHMLAYLEVTTCADKEKHMTVYEDLSTLEKELKDKESKQ